MRVIHLSLADFRNYERAEVALEPGPNLIVGRNGQGKTNLVEAIAYFAALRSHRVSSDAALIRAGRETGIARMRIAVNDREALLEIELNRHAPNRAQVNRNVARPREVTRWFSTVVFAPEDLMIVRGDPGGRRRFLDDALIARNPALASVLSDYERVVRQRTALLKSARASGARSAVDATLSVWDEQLIALGSRILFERRRLIAALRDPLRESYRQLVAQDHGPGLGLEESISVQRGSVGNAPTAPADDVSRETGESDDASAPVADEVDVSRETREAIEDEFRAALVEVRAQELERAVTLVGPHRDDAVFELNGLPVKGYASHGESWSFALSLRLAVAELLRRESPAGDPVIVLDDVFAELDAGRRARLMAAVGSYEQVIVTAAVEADVPSELSWHRVRVDAGRVLGNGEDLSDAAIDDAEAHDGRGATNGSADG